MAVFYLVHRQVEVDGYRKIPLLVLSRWPASFTLPSPCSYTFFWQLNRRSCHIHLSVGTFSSPFFLHVLKLDLQAHLPPTEIRLSVHIRVKATRMTELDLLWGRKTDATWWTAFASLVLVFGSPLWISFMWIGLEYHNGSVYETAVALSENGLYSFCHQYAPRFTMNAFVGYAAWLSLQALFFTLLPGPISTGQMTPAGNLLEYKTNGLLAWVITHCVVIFAGAVGVVNLATVANHWMGLLIAANIYGYLLALFCQIKAHVSPSHPSDRKFSGTAIYLCISKAVD